VTLHRRNLLSSLDIKDTHIVAHSCGNATILGKGNSSNSITSIDLLPDKFARVRTPNPNGFVIAS
jgi:hypothetical protein